MFGLLPSGEGLVSADYSIDGGPPMRKELDALVNESLPLGNSSYFISPTLLNGPHNLSITVTDTGLGRNYTLDFFDILSPSSEPNVKTPSTTEDTRKPDAGIIVAGVVSVVALVVFLAFGLRWIWRRRARPATETELNKEKDAESYMVTEIGRYYHNVFGLCKF